MPCNCGKKAARPWSPRAREAQVEQAPEGATHRIVSGAERQSERDNAQRPPRARQPQA